jgi:hypothetical protein
MCDVRDNLVSRSSRTDAKENLTPGRGIEHR